MTQDPEIPNEEQASKLRERRWLFWARAIFVVCLLPLVFVAAAAVMIIDRDITAPTWIKTQLATRASEVVPGARLDFGAISMRIGRDLHPRVRLYDSRLTDADGVLIGRVPLVDGLISPRGLVLQQDVLIQEIRLTGAQINLRRAADGSLSFAFAGDSPDVDAAPTLPELLDGFDAIFQRPALEAFELIRAEGLVANFSDARAGRNWTVDGGTAELDLRGGQSRISADFALLSGGDTPTRARLTYASPRGERSAQIALSLDDAATRDIAVQSPALSWLQGIDAPVTTALRTSLDDEGALGPLNVSLNLGRGVFQPNPASAPVPFEQADAYFNFDPASGKLVFSQASIDTEWGGFAAEGQAYLQDLRDGLPTGIVAQLRFSDVGLNPPGFYSVPPDVPPVEVDLRAQFAPFTLEVGQIVLSNADTRALARGRVAATDAGWDIALDARVDQITPEAFASYWPMTMKPRSRAWFASNVQDGMLRDIVAGLRSRPELPTDFALGFEFSETQIQLLSTLPPIKDATGVASIIDHRFAISLDRGTVFAAQGGPLDLAGTDFEIEDTRQNPSLAHLDLQTDSSVTGALSILNQPPFSYMDKAGLPVVLADGRAATQGRITWPLTSRPASESIKMDMTAQLSSVRSDTLVPGRSFASPALTVKASRQGVNIGGALRLGQVDAVGVWDQRFGDPERTGSRIVADVVLDQAFLDEFGIALPANTLGGAGRAQLEVSFQEETPPAFALSSDLAGVTLNVPAIGWGKSSDATGTLEINGALGDVPVIEYLSLQAPNLRALGRVDLDPQGSFASARFARVQVGNWLDAPVNLIGRGAGQPVGVEMRGGALDLRGAPVSTGGGDGGPMTLALERLQVSNGIALTDFRGDFRNDGGFRGEFTGQVNGEAAISGTLAPRDGRSGVKLRSDDAGAVLRAAGFMRNALGGVLDLTLLPTGRAGTFDGLLDIRSIRVRDAPSIAALLDAVSVVGLLQQLDGQGLAFDEVDATFRLTPQQVIVTEGSAVGPGLGISVDGIYTLANKSIDLQGVVSPFFLVNSIGSFLTRRGEGLIGFNYTIGGTTDTPQVAVNPLSALTPGMFREIFRRPAPEVSQ